MRYLKSFPNDAAIQTAVDSKELGKPYVALNESAGTIDWDSKEPDYTKMYMTVEALESGDFYVRKSGIGYSVNGGAWETTTGATTLSLNQGDAVRFKKNTYTESHGNQIDFTGNTISFVVYGNVESMEYGDEFVGKNTIKYQECFRGLFFNCSGLTDASNLILPALTLKERCYQTMFTNCIKLTTAPELPATTLAGYCYQTMFSGCVKLNYVKCLATNISATSCTGVWLRDVSSTGTFVKAAGMNSWTTGNAGIPSGWTVIDAQ